MGRGTTVSAVVREWLSARHRCLAIGRDRGDVLHVAALVMLLRHGGEGSKGLPVRVWSHS